MDRENRKPDEDIKKKSVITRAAKGTKVKFIGRPKRELIIQNNEVLDLIIDLHTLNPKLFIKKYL